MRTLTKEQILSIERRRKEGKKNKEIAADMGISISTLLRWTRRLQESGRNIPKRKAGAPKILDI